MDWRLILAEFLATLIARVAPVLVEMIADWLESMSANDKVALLDGVAECLREKKAA